MTDSPANCYMDCDHLLKSDKLTLILMRGYVAS